MFYRIANKFIRELYRLTHPLLFRKNAQINGIPVITKIRNLTLGNNVSFNADVYIQCAGKVAIGDNVTLSRGVTILTNGLDLKDYLHSSKQQFRNHVVKDVCISEGAWLGANVTVCPGAFIPEGAVIAAGAVVAGHLDYPRYIYAGVPAHPIKRLDVSNNNERVYSSIFTKEGD